MRPSIFLLLGVLTVLDACSGPTVDLSKGLQIEVVSTGWYDAGIVNGKNRLVPQISFKVKNVSDQKLVSLQINGLFRRLTEKDEWGNAFVTAAGSAGLPAGASTSTLTLKSQLGYTGTDPRADMLQNTKFVDVKVELFAKYGSAQWTRIGDFPVDRQLILPQ
jgi:hypothetical protein